jgi:hypothetical protein
MSPYNNANRSRPAAARRSMSVRALPRLNKAEALVQLVERPDLAANISAAARLWGVSRAPVRAWLAECAAMAVPPEPPVHVLLDRAATALNELVTSTSIDAPKRDRFEPVRLDAGERHRHREPRRYRRPAS